MKTEKHRRTVAIVLGATVSALLTIPSTLASAAETSVAVAEDPRTAPLDQIVPVSADVITGEFANGLRYFIRESAEPRNRAELRFVVRAGSILEDPDQLGIAHFLEHMAFNGSTHFEKQELIAYMESIGMRLGPGINASTSFDETVFQMQIPTDSPANMRTAFQILEDWAHGLTLDTTEIDKERGVVIEEWRGGQGAGSRIRDQMLKVLLKDSRYAERIPIGTRESIETFAPDALRRFYRDWYRPELMGVIVVGDFDADEILPLLRQHLEILPKSAPTARHRQEYSVPAHPNTLLSLVTDKEVSDTSIAIYHKMPYADDWTIGGYRRQMIENLYNAILNRRFGEIARRPGSPLLRASSAKSRLVGAKGAYVLGAMVTEHGIESGLDALLTEAARVEQFGFTATELEREKIDALRSIESVSMRRETRSSGSFANEYVRSFLHGESIPGIQYEFELVKRFLPTITLAEVNEIGRTWIQEADRVVTITAPDKDGLAMPAEQRLLDIMAAVSARPVEPWLDRVSDQPLLAEVPVGVPVVASRTLTDDITEWTLRNGIRVILKPTNFQDDQILIRGFSPGGTSLASDAQFVPATTAVSIVTGGGIGAFDAIELRKRLSGKVASVSPGISLYEEGFYGSSSPQDLETLFQLVYLAFTAPRADPEYFSVFNAQGRQMLANRNSNPMTVFNDAFNRILTQDHPRLRPPTVATFDSTNLEQSLAFYKERFADAGDYTVILVGDIDLAVMQPLVEHYLGGLPATGRKESWRDVGIRAPVGVYRETVYKGVEPRSQTRLSFTGPFDYNDTTERTVIRLMAMVLETRLHNLLREDKGNTYGVSVSSGTAFLPIESYSVNIGFGSAPEHADEMAASVLTEIARLQGEPPSIKEVADIREAALRQFETDLRQNGLWMQQLAIDYQRGSEPGASLRAYPALVRELSPESIQAAASLYLNLKNYVQVTLMPEVTPTGDGDTDKAERGSE